MMQCSACGNEVSESRAYCPWCGSKTVKAEEATSLKRLAAEEKLRDLRRYEILWGVLAGVSLVSAIFCVWVGWKLSGLGVRTPWSVVGSMVLGFAVATVSAFVSRQMSRQRQELLKKLEKGKFE